MNIYTGRFKYPERHHHGWFRVFRFHGAIEIWLGQRWALISWRR